MQERSKDRLLRVHEKGTYRSRMNSKLAALRKAITPRNEEEEEDEESDDVDGIEKASRIHKQTQFVLATTRGESVVSTDNTISVKCMEAAAYDYYISIHVHVHVPSSYM